MATRSNIAIILKEEDKARVFAELNKRLEDAGNNRFRYGVDNGNVLQIYCHWDGYLEGVGRELIDCFNSYDDALKLILEGDCSYIEGGVACHYTSKGEDWESNRPEQRMHAKCLEDYLYVFKDGVWKIPVIDENIDIEYIDDEGYCSLKDYSEFRY
jgi:hypothetical protein